MWERNCTNRNNHAVGGILIQKNNPSHLVKSPFSVSNLPACMYFSSCSRLCSTSAGVSVKIFFGGNAGTTLLPYSFFICLCTTQSEGLHDSRALRSYTVSICCGTDFLSIITQLIHNSYNYNTQQ